VANLVKSICYENKDRLMAGMIVAGWDKSTGGSVYAVPLGGTLVKSPYTVGGSGSTYLYGFCDANYREGMTQSETMEFVRSALAHAMARDGSSGGVIRTVVITEDGIDRDFVAGDALPFMLS